MKYFELTKQEQAILRDVERGNFRSVRNLQQAKRDAVVAARLTLGKTRNINIRLSGRDLQKIKGLAAEKGLPYQTLISAVIHQYSDRRINVAD